MNAGLLLVTNYFFYMNVFVLSNASEYFTPTQVSPVILADQTSAQVKGGQVCAVCV